MSKVADISPTSIRLPGPLRKRLEDASGKAHQSLTDFITTAIEMRLAGACESCGRDYGAKRLKERIVELAKLLAKVDGVK